ncbi:MAG: DNA polymerase/3'-5' exonuclease PolX [Methanomassiliicoccus sp.]|nr:DNA polymerase/3'-5' exonuclease PolX [Methanomassiliicoccus sp.]
MNNAEIADLLHEFADLMDLKGDVFKRNAYRRAAQNVLELDGDITSYYREGRLESIPGVGESIAKKIAEVLETGRSPELEDLQAQYPPGLIELTQVPDLGPKKALRLYRELGIQDLAGLKQAALEHRIRRLEGFGERSEKKILQGIELVERNSGRMLLGDALPIGLAVESYLRQNGIEHVSVAGSLRRRKETIGDIDIVVGSDLPLEAMRLFASYPRRDAVILQGPTRSSIRLEDGTQVDLRVVPISDYGATLLYFTGSKEHTVELRRMAIQMGYKLNEYGLFRKDDGSVVAREEKDIYRALGLDLVPPELREMRGEIEAAKDGRLPDLLRSEDVRGDLHVHTVMSDGHATMRQLAQEAKRLGYEYLGLTDHSSSLRIAHGLSAEDLLDSVEEARQVSEEEGIVVLRGSEVDILEDGSLDYPREVLSQLDFVIASVHSLFHMPEEEMTERVLRAISDPEVNILGHPTGRLLGRREAYKIDLERVMEHAHHQGVALELNGYPYRLDLNDLNSRKAKERGVKLSIGTDAHALEDLNHMSLAVGTARRGWLEKQDVINTLSLAQIRRFFERGSS